MTKFREGGDVHPWTKSKAVVFVVLVCSFVWALLIAAAFGSDATISISGIGFSIDTDFVLITYAWLFPAIYCLLFYPECRASLKKVRSGFFPYAVAILVGLIPFLSLVDPTSIWGSVLRWRFAAWVAINLFYAPLWEEIVWRGCFLKKIRSFLSPKRGIVVMSSVYCAAQLGYYSYLYTKGNRLSVLLVLLLLAFCFGMILGSLFELSRDSLWPCVLLHAEFTCSATGLTLSIYVVALILTAIAAWILFWVATRRSVTSISVGAAA